MSKEPTQTTPLAPWRSACCEGETCSMCGEPAAAKVGEEIFSDDPNPHRHNLTAYVCAEHFAQIMGPFGRRMLQEEAVSGK